MTYSSSSSFICNASLPGPSLEQMCSASAFVVFMSLLDELIRSNDKISGRCERIESIETADEEYDFVVIGGGGAGSVVAGRLSENPNWKILVLEAGHDEPASGQIPLFAAKFVGTEIDWNYTSINESYACLANNGSCESTSAKVLGGGTSRNGMIYFRGNPTDYNNWADQGNEGWTWEDVQPFYLLGEDNGEIDRVGRLYHGTGGPLSVERFRYIPPFRNSLLAASDEVGYGISEDLNGEQITGFSEAQAMTKNGVRLSSASAYLRPVRNRRNLHVSLNSLATKVIIENEEAVGVEYFKNGQRRTVLASKEVIVAAGAIRSPHLLFLSGIGPTNHLESFGIKVVKDLPAVGENFHNHLGYILNFTINEPDKYDNDWSIATQYLVNQTGPLSGLGIIAMVAILESETASPGYPDLQLACIGYAEVCAPGEIGALRSSGKRTVYITTINLHPESRGRISLASNDPFEYPLIWGNYLSEPADLDRVVKAIRKALALVDTEAMRALNFTLSHTQVEACSEYEYLSDDYWKCATKQSPYLQHHFAGSCKMGPSSDSMAVVDPRLRVHAMKRLRVTDASIMPQVISGNSAASAIMIGERAADFIKKDWARESGEKSHDHRSSSKCHLIRKDHFPELQPSQSNWN